MGSSASDKEMNKEVSNTKKMSPRIPVEKGSSSYEECDDLDDEFFEEYKKLSYRLFQYETYKLRSSKGDFGCPFCDDYKAEHQNQYVHLLFHAIKAGEDLESGKRSANHYAMAAYLVYDLASAVKAEADRLSFDDGKTLKRPRVDESGSTKVVELERERAQRED